MKLYEYKIKRTYVRDIKSDKLMSPESAVKAARAMIDFDREQEQLIVILLDGTNKIKGSFVSTVGILNSSQIHPREIFRSAILAGAAGIILAHNHPTEDVEPSLEDKAVMTRIQKASEIIGIKLVDSLIVTETKYYSFREKEEF